MYGRLTSAVFAISIMRITYGSEAFVETNASVRSGRTDLDGPEASTMFGRQVLVEPVDSLCARELTHLPVHVVGARARVVS